MKTAGPMKRDEVHALLAEVFEQEGLFFGGLLAVGAIEDNLVWRIVRGLDAIRRLALRRIGDANGSGRPEDPNQEMNLRPHPAIEEFLRKVRKG